VVIISICIGGVAAAVWVRQSVRSPGEALPGRLPDNSWPQPLPPESLLESYIFSEWRRADDHRRKLASSHARTDRRAGRACRVIRERQEFGSHYPVIDNRLGAAPWEWGNT
jgi:hypothetical protein